MKKDILIQNYLENILTEREKLAIMQKSEFTLRKIESTETDMNSMDRLP